MCIAIYTYMCIRDATWGRTIRCYFCCMETLCNFEENMLSNHIHGKLLWRMVSKWVIPLNDTMCMYACMLETEHIKYCLNCFE